MCLNVSMRIIGPAQSKMRAFTESERKAGEGEGGKEGRGKGGREDSE